ncbi:MAG TPA: hypothetical protein VFD63_00200 [Pyrinomonadaceae bacterium]|nr:hypothetical protein [Pyrinomonadaceae bacterium]
MKRLKAIFFIVGLFIGITPAALADDPHAQEVLKQARTALGGDERLQKVESLNITGQYRRMLGERQLGGDREVSILLPNKYLVEDALNPGGLSTAMINTRVLNGDRAWSSSSGGGPGMIFRIGGPGGQQLSPEQMEAAFRKSYQAEFTRYLLALVLSAPSSIPVEYTYVGESDVDETPADVVDVIGPDKLWIRLFFDKKTHMPMLLSYRGPKPRIVTMTRPPEKGSKPEDMKKLRDEAEKKISDDNAGKPEEVDFYIRLSDYKKVDGLMFPYKFTFLTENEVSEEFEISKYQVNPQFKADKFEKH